MNRYPNRTYNTRLSDNELILFDVLFDGDVPFDSLVDGSRFMTTFNYYCHTLNKTQFNETINTLVDDGYFKYITGGQNQISRKIGTHVGLTQKGGELWEREREPIWENYIFDLYNYKDDGSVDVFIYSPSKKVVKSYFKVLLECKLLKMSSSKEIFECEIKGTDFIYIPWKNFSKMCEIKIHFKEEEYVDDQQDVDWNYYEKQKIWWKDINDLLAGKKWEAQS